MTSVRAKVLEEFQKTAGIRFRSQELLNLSFIHRSICNEAPETPRNNERLEFLGDAILGAVVASRLYRLFENRQEGELARIKSFIVSEDTLAGIALGLGIDGLLLLGKGEEISGGRKKKAILADAMEALLGSYFLDSGFEAVESFILNLVDPEIEKVLGNRHNKDYKTIIQEYVQKFRQAVPSYVSGESIGPDHNRTFRVFCHIGTEKFGPALGKTKKEAEQAAARIAYECILRSGGIEAERLLDAEGR